MTFMDGLLLTLLNTVVCLALPKFLSVIGTKGKNSASPQTLIKSSESNAEIPGMMDAA